jgi:hypothetical protein
MNEVDSLDGDYIQEAWFIVCENIMKAIVHVTVFYKVWYIFKTLLFFFYLITFVFTTFLNNV